MDKIKTKDESAFKELCYDCIYYGYYWDFIKDNYLKNWNFTEEEAKKLYDETIEDMENL